MFAKTRCLAAGAAALTPVVTIGLPAVAHAASTPAPAPAPAKNHCVVNALSAAQIQAGVKSVLVCFETKQQAETAATGGSGPVTSTIGQGAVIATFYKSTSLDSSGSLMVRGLCSDTIPWVDDSWLPYMVAWAPQGCTSAKSYTGGNFTGTAVRTSGAPYYYQPPLLRAVRSLSFG